MSAAAISSPPDLIGALLGATIGVLVIAYRRRIAHYAAQGFQMGGSEASLARVYGVLGALAVVIAIASVFVL